MSKIESKLKELQKKLRIHVDEQIEKWDSFVYAQQNGFYQGFEEIGIDGCRPTEKRFARYQIEKYLSKDKMVLDIGCNCGFLTIYLSRFLKHIDGVELNPFLTNIGKDTKEFLGEKNVEFHTSSFEEFKTDKKYEIIFSLANDDTIDGNTKFTFNEYIKKIQELIQPKGILMWETISPDTYDPKLFEPKRKILEEKFILLEERMVKSEYPINVPERRFLVLQKK
jgi:2-polyprenyl-3-methyl-5-hydroxy-6-metoxy-1,4-benzoquinol methylase